VTPGGREVASTTVVVALVLGGLLLSGQAAQIHRALGTSLPVDALGLGLVALAEVLLPLSAMLGTGLAYGRWRGEAHLTALSALGVRPVRLLAPALFVGVSTAGVTAVFATTFGPRALAALADRWDASLARAAYHGDGLALGDAGRVRGVVRADGHPGEIWAVFAQGETLAILRADGLVAVAGGGVGLQGVQLHAGPLRARLGEVHWDEPGGPRRPGALRPPQTMPDDALSDRPDPQAVYTRARRRALAALCLPAALLGALLGGAWGRARGLLAGIGAAGLLYWALRAGAVAVRDERWAPMVAAWLPVVVLVGLTAMTARIGWDRFRA
jgi:lipopolysaccharide export LptBFGC system permease protein LptF